MIHADFCEGGTFAAPHSKSVTLYRERPRKESGAPIARAVLKMPKVRGGGLVCDVVFLFGTLPADTSPRGVRPFSGGKDSLMRGCVLFRSRDPESNALDRSALVCDIVLFFFFVSFA